MENDAVLDGRQLTPPQRHALIFNTYGRLNSSEGFVLVNDRGPEPFYYQFQAQRPGEGEAGICQARPDIWSVRIGRR